MSRFLPRLSFSTATVVALALILPLAGGFYSASAIEPTPAFELLRVLTIPWVLGCWMRADSRTRNETLAYDLGFFLYCAWPIVVPYYLFTTRGFRALIPIAAFLLVALVASLFGVALGVFLQP